MTRKGLLILAALMILGTTLAPAGASSVSASAPRGWDSLVGPINLNHGKGKADPGDNPAVGMATNRVNAWTPHPAGTHQTIVLQYGPYVVHPGSDLPRADAEAVVGQNGFVIAAAPVVRYADGSVPSLLQIHIHHAHWVWPDPNNPNAYRWFYGTGEEQTQGSIDLRAQSDPRYLGAEKLRYGIQLQQGTQLAFLSMLHNKTSETQVVWLEARLEFVYGTAEEIAAATGEHFHALTPILHGSTFNVPRTGGIYAWPKDATAAEVAGYGSTMKRGVGHTWTSPFNGTIVVGAGHMHPGGNNVVVENLGSQSSPCGGTWLSDPDGDGYPGVALVRSNHITRADVRPSEDFQMGVTQPGWRATVRQGDVIAINGVYDTTTHAYPDAMSFFGFYTDQSEQMTAPCTSSVTTSTLVPTGTTPSEHAVGVNWPSDPTFTSINRDWSQRQALPICTACDANLPAASYGPNTTVITISKFTYVPGDLSTVGAVGAPVVKQGDSITFVNTDMAAGIRHSITSCPAPCDGPYVANYPFPDGRIESGVMGQSYQYLETYVSVTNRPDWTLSTASLAPSLYTFFCRLHPWMRGEFYVTTG